MHLHLAPARQTARVALLLALAVGSAGRGVAHAGPAAVPGPATVPQPAPCAAELAWAAGYAARNYAGYIDKVTPVSRRGYAALLDTLGAVARRATGPAACDTVLGRWAAFFRDRHLSTFRRSAPSATSTRDAVPVSLGGVAGGRSAPAGVVPDTSPALLRVRFAAWPRSTSGGRPLDEATAVSRLSALGTARDPIEGVWESTGGPGAIRYRVAVLRDGMLDRPAGAPPGSAPASGFTMVVLRADSAWWTPGQVKARIARDTAPVPPTDVRVGVPFTYRVTLYLRDHTPDARVFRAGPLLLLLGNGERWLRRWPVPDLTAPAAGGPEDAARTTAAQEAAVDAETFAGFGVRALAPGTLLVRVPTFDDARGMDSLMVAEGARLRAAERLVVDVRRNGGGSDYNYRALRPLLYTQPVRAVGTHALATDDNRRAWRALLGDTARFPAAQRADIARMLRRLDAGRGGWVDLGDDAFTEPAVLARPRRVAVLADGGCGSSCEQFLLEARQSRKVTLYGAPSAGVLDYANVRTADAAAPSRVGAGVPGSTLVLAYPTTRSKRLPADPVDNVGVRPAVPVPPDAAFPVDWVRRHLEAADAAPAGPAGAAPHTTR